MALHEDLSDLSVRWFEQFYFTDVQRRCFLSGPFLFMFCVFHAVLSVHYSLVATCCEKAGLLALLNVMFSCVIVTSLSHVLSWVMFGT